MFIRRQEVNEDHLHLMLYGPGGVGKTKGALDFHKADQPAVVISTEQSRMLLDQLQGEVPLYVPPSFEEFALIVQNPKVFISEFLQKEFPGYEPKTFLFDGVKGFQQLLVGTETQQKKKLFGGAIETELVRGTGLLGQGAGRTKGGAFDLRQLHRDMDPIFRGVVAQIDKMPFHTIITAHDEVSFSRESKFK